VDSSWKQTTENSVHVQSFPFAKNTHGQTALIPPWLCASKPPSYHSKDNKKLQPQLQHLLCWFRSLHLKKLFQLRGKSDLGLRQAMPPQVMSPQPDLCMDRISHKV